MRAAVLHEFGGALALEDVPEPQAGDGQAIVDVRAAGINFADVLVRQGRYPQPPPLPTILGNEVAGEIGGRRVLAFVRQSGGGYAERVAVDDTWVFDLPRGATFAEGASFLTTFLTAFVPLTRQARVGPGSHVLVTAAAGGVGTAALQLAVFMGARVTAAAGSEEKRALALELGAAVAIPYEEIAALRDVDVALDPVGGPVFSACLGALKPLGVAIGIGFAGGPWEPLDPARLVGRNTGALGFYLGRLMSFEPELVRSDAVELLELWKRGLVRPHVGATFALDEVNEAHDLVASRRSVGKVVLVP
ncbi:MAG TPA: zinc-binding dehydrogenase [Gaiellaceae bacterium]|nr:zinc-binding dehydrogenase [Gaiellaceae bacterium]